MIRFIQVVGLQRSGTTWLQNMLRANFTADQPRSVEFGNSHKHKFPAVLLGGGPYGAPRTLVEALARAGEDQLVIVISKRIDLWLESIARKKTNMPRVCPHILDERFRILDGPARAHYRQFYESWAKVDLPHG